MKKIAVVLFMLMFLVSANSAFAGQKQRHRWEGVAAGVGATVLFGHIFNSCLDSRESRRYDYEQEEPRRYYPPPPASAPNYGRGYYGGMSAGEQAAYNRGLSERQAEIQAQREDDAYNQGYYGSRYGR